MSDYAAHQALAASAAERDRWAAKLSKKPASPVQAAAPGAMRATVAGTGHIPSWTEIKALLATTLRPALLAAARCNETDCCSFGQTRAGSCACSRDEDALIAADLLNASDKAHRAHRANESRAMRLQLNNKSGYES